MSIKFIHRRYIDIPDQVSCRGGITVGYQYDEKAAKIKLAVYRCNEFGKLNFCKRIGRDVTTGRLVSNKPGRNTELDLKGVTTVTPAVVEDIVWGWLENQERLWAAKPITHTVQ
jgi:hypothetical protein